ncbi:MAG: carboxypeptidase regulatory-like domain-containing protein [Bryobacteraceae bacterium]
MSLRTRVALAAILAIGFSSSPRLSAQAVYGNIVGTVLDASGAAIAGAKVTIRNVERDVTNTTTTNESGNYSQRYLIVGRYQVRVEAPGFKSFQQDNVGVSVDSEALVDIKLEVGEAAQTLEVSAEASLLKTERSDVSTTYSQKAVAELPMLSRRFTNFQLITPGVSLWPVSLTAASPENPQGSYRLLVNGQSFAGVSHLLDGTDNHDAVLGWIVINPTLESVTEAKVTTADYDAEFGTSAAAVVSAQTKSGTNAIHGSAFEFLRNDHLQARNPFTQSIPIYGTNGREIPVTQWNQFGGSIGGPIKKNKLFYFGDYQGTRRNTGGSVLLRVPSLAERTGNLSGLGLDIYNPASGSTPATRTAFPGAIIPASLISAQAANLLKFIPAPNINASKDQPNYAGSGAVGFNDDAFNTRVDWYASEKMHVFGRYSFVNFGISSPGIYGYAGGPGFDPSGGTSAFAGSSTSLNHSIAAGFDYVLNPALFTDFRFGFFRYQVNVVPNGLSTAPATDAGIPGLNLDKQYTGGMPAFFINDYGNNLFKFGYALGVNSCNCPLNENEKQFQFVNNWSKIRGNHSFKFGADIRQAHNLRVPSDQHRAGQLSFNAAGTQGPNGGGSGLATYLLGDVQLFQRYISSVTDARETQNRWFFYGQDTWRISQKLTLNYGLRWELYRPQTVNGPGKGGFIDIGTGEVLVAGSQGVGLNLNVQGRLTDLAPRIGIAYQITPKTVIRSGYGRGYDLGIFGSVFGHNVTQNLPVLGIQTLTPANNFDTVFTLAQGPTPLDAAGILNSQKKGPNGRPLLPNGVTPFVISQNMRLPTVDAWNFSVQRQLTGTISAEAAYVGNKGTHVFAGTGGDYDPNQATLVGYGTLSLNQRKPYFQKFGWSQTLRYFGSDASNNYNALQTKVEKRFSQGLQLLAHYTWSRNIDYSGTYFPVDATYARGVSDNNRNHAVVIASLWEVPFGKGRKYGSNLNRGVDFLLGGWQANGIYNWASGLPFTPSYQACNSDRDTGWCKPNVLGDWHAKDPSQFGWFATTDTLLNANGQVSGPWQRPQKGVQGNVGRNALYGPRFSQLDMSFFKTVPVTERVRVQFRAESFNFTNHTNLGRPNGCVDCPGVSGRIFNAIGNYVPRQWQLATRIEF